MTIETLEKKLKPYEVPARGPLLRKLYAHFPPRVIENKAMHSRYMKAVEIIMMALEMNQVPPAHRNEAEKFLDVITQLIEAYEKREYPMKAEPEDVLRFLMEQHNLKQEDLAEELGGQSVVSDILHGKRSMTRDHIEKLSRRFHMSPASFFPA